MVEQQIGLLRQIQHLILIRDEEAKTGGGAKTRELSEKMAKLILELEPAARALHLKLSARNPMFMSALSRGNCSACGMKIPTSDLQHVLGKDRLVGCRGCGRILYVPEVKSTGIRQVEPDPKYLLSRFSGPKLMIPALKAHTPEAAIAELCGVLAKDHVIDDPDKVIAAALEREHILTTAVGNGLAFPHMRGVEEGLLTFSAGVAPGGIDWNGQTVNLVFFTTMPIAASPFYLKLLSAIAKTFEDGEKLPFVLSASDAKTLWKELNKATRVEVKHM